MSELAGLHEVLALQCPWVLAELAEFDFVVDVEGKTVRFLDRKRRPGVVNFVRKEFLATLTPACEALLGPGTSTSAEIRVAWDPTPECRRERTAVHEAGHAVVAFVLGVEIRKVTIRPALLTRRLNRSVFGSSALDAQGQMETIGHVELMDVARIQRRRCAMVSLAGSESERLLLGAVPDGFISYVDLGDAMRHLAATTPPRRFRGLGIFGRQVWIHGLRVELVRLVTEHRDAVRRVADALLEWETLSGDDVAAIVRGDA